MAILSFLTLPEAPADGENKLYDDISDDDLDDLIENVETEVVEKKKKTGGCHCTDSR